MKETSLLFAEPSPAWNPCSCGQLKPRTMQECWRCTNRGDEFRYLDALISAGWGSTQQELIPEEVKRSFHTGTPRANERRAY